MRRFNWIVILLSLALLGASVVSAHEDWTVVKAESLADLLGSDRSLQTVSLSPDGKTLAWGEAQQLCLYTIDTTETACYGVPDTFAGFGGRYAVPTWSPDSRTLAFTESLFDYFLDSDIWVFNVENATFENRTDDNYLGGLIPRTEDENRTNFFIDYLPTWNPVNGDLYFFRSTRPEEGDITMALELMPLGRKEPKQVVDFSAKFPVLSVYRQPVISPDGTRMAITVLGNDRADPLNGVYVFDLKRGDLHKVLSTEQFATGLPDWAVERNELYPDAAPRWVGNDALVLTLLDASFSTSLSQSALYINLTDDSVTGLVDYSGIESPVDMFNDLTDLSSPIYTLPRAGVVTPEGDTFLFLGAFPQSGEAVISIVPLPAAEPVAPVQIGHIENFAVNRGAAGAPTISDDGTRALLYGYLVTLERE